MHVASDLLSGAPSTQKEADTFFQTAVQDQFFREKSNDAAAVIARMTQAYCENPNQVMILISDLMIPTEDDCMKAAKALKSAVITPVSGSTRWLPTFAFSGGVTEVHCPVARSRRCSVGATVM